MTQQLRALAALAKDPVFSSQHTYGNSQSSVIPVPGDQMTFSDHPGHQAPICDVHTYTGKTTNIKNVIRLLHHVKRLTQNVIKNLNVRLETIKLLE